MTKASSENSIKALYLVSKLLNLEYSLSNANCEFTNLFCTSAIWDKSFPMSIIFFLVVTPIGLIMRILGKDLVNLKYNNNKTYWIEKTGPKSKMKNQF